MGPNRIVLKNLRNKLQKKCYSRRNDFFRRFGRLKTNFSIEQEPKIQIFVRQLERFIVDKCACCLADFIVTELEKRAPFRRIFRMAEERAQSVDEVFGIRFQVSGRLNGVDIARKEWFRKGSVPLHTFSANLDYSFKTAYTTYGLLGIKVWIFTKEREENLHFHFLC
jgi:small subunit ribosomal protein S3